MWKLVRWKQRLHWREPYLDRGRNRAVVRPICLWQPLRDDSALELPVPELLLHLKKATPAVQLIALRCREAQATASGGHGAQDHW